MQRTDLQALKNNIDLIPFVEKMVELRSVGGGEFVGRCPFHTENTASFRVSSQRFHCFGCHAHGDIFNWLTRTTGRSFRDVVLDLSNGRIEFAPCKKNEQKILQSIVDFPAINNIVKANEKLQRLFRTQFIRSKDVQDSLGKRVHTPSYYGLGYAPNDPTLIPRALKALGYDNEFGVQAGLVFKGDNGYCGRLRHRITIPLYSGDGRILGFSGRLVGESHPGVPKYIEPPTTPAFKKSHYLYGQHCISLSSKTPIIVVEGYFDQIALSQLGYARVVACLGTHISDAQIRILESLTDTIITCFDGDLPGLNATFAASRYIHTSSLNIRHALLTDGLDPEEIPKPISYYPEISALDFYRNSIVTELMKDEYDRSLLDQLTKPYVDANVKSGYLQYNVIPWVIQAYPQYAPSLKAALMRMCKDLERLPNGKLSPKRENILAFIHEWKKPCKEVRQKNQ